MEKIIETTIILLVIWASPLFVTPVGQYGELQGLAQEKVNDLVETNYWEHTNSDGCDFKCRTQGYTNDGRYSWIGENLYRTSGRCNEQEAYQLWKESPTHNFVLEHEADEEILLQGSNDDYCYLVLIKGIVK
jgi:hypothetical protein